MQQSGPAERVIAFLQGPTGRKLAAAWRAAPDHVLRDLPIALRLTDADAPLILDRPAEPCWVDAGGEALERLRSEAVSMAGRIAEPERHRENGEAWPRLERRRCHALRCSFIARRDGA